MKKKIIIFPLLLIISFILIMVIINNRKKEIKYVISFSNSNKSEIITEHKLTKLHLVSQEKFNNKTEGLKITDEFITQNNKTNIFYTKQISWDTLTNNITLSKDKVTWWIRDEIKYLHENLFTNNVTYSVTNLFEILINSYQLDSIDLTNSSYSTGLMSLRYRQLLPYVKQILLQSNQIANRDVAIKCTTWLGKIQHPDTLRTILELDKLIPEDSYIRKKTRFGYLPFFYRKDCLDVYIEVANQPEKYDHDMWYAAAYKIGWFTNDIAISANNRAYKTMKEFKKYWPESPDSLFLNIRCLKEQIKTQQEIIDGEKPPRRQPKPLLDE